MDNKLQLNQEEARIVRAAMFAYERTATSDEPSYANSPEFEPLFKKVNTFIIDENNRTDHE